MTRIPDLWGHAITVDVLTPAAILNVQAALLKRKTQGNVIAELETTTDRRRIVTINFDLVAPAVDNFRARVLVVRHKTDYVYPALVTSSAFAGNGGGQFGDLKWGGVEDGLSKLAETETQFISLLQEALQSGAILSIVQSLIAKSNEAREQPSLPDVASDVTKEEAMQRLRAAGFVREANELEVWRDANGNNWGWDGWIRGAHPHVIATIWP